MQFVIHVVQTAFRLYSYLLLARILLSWFQPNPYHPVVRFLYQSTEPVLAPFRRLLPPLGGIDFSPILAFFVLQIVETLVVRLLYQLDLLLVGMVGGSG